MSGKNFEVEIDTDPFGDDTLIVLDTEVIEEEITAGVSDNMLSDGTSASPLDTVELDLPDVGVVAEHSIPTPADIMEEVEIGYDQNQLPDKFPCLVITGANTKEEILHLKSLQFGEEVKDALVPLYVNLDGYHSEQAVYPLISTAILRLKRFRYKVDLYTPEGKLVHLDNPEVLCNFIRL